MEVITSTENKKVKEWNKLKQKKYRDQENKFLIEGDHLIKEAYLTKEIEELILLDEVGEVNYNINTYFVNRKVMKKLSEQDSIAKCMAVVKKSNYNNYGNRLMILDNIQDPGNLGTIIRSAVGFNIDTIILGNNCVDLYNAKTIRASEGLIFHIPILRKELSLFLEELNSNGYTTYGTSVSNGIILEKVKFPMKCAIVIGNEGQGISQSLKEKIKKNIFIPTSEELESLNAAVAASIIMYEMSKVDYE